MYVGMTMFRSIFARQFVFGQFWSKKLFLVNFGQKMVLVDFGQKKLVLDRKNWFQSILAVKIGLRRFWLEKLGFDRKTGFGRFWPKKVVLVNFD